MMKAAIYTEYGDPDVLTTQRIEKPSIKANEVLIKVISSSATTGDCHVRQADPWAVRLFNGLMRPKRQVLGSDLAGIIEAVGSEVTKFKKGDEIFGAAGLGLGSNAEYIGLPEDAPIALKPNNLNFDQAAAIPFGAVTARYFLQTLGQVTPEQRVLIYGASGALGVYAVQIAKHILGAHVTAVCSGRNAQLVKDLGADDVINYQEFDYACGDFGRWDVIFDTLGKTRYQHAKPVLNPAGKFLAAAGGLKEFQQNLSSYLLSHSLFAGIGKWLGFSRHRIITGIAVEQQKDIEYLKQAIENNQIKPVIDRSYSLDDIARAHEYISTGRKRGSVIIKVA